MDPLLLKYSQKYMERWMTVANPETSSEKIIYQTTILVLSLIHINCVRDANRFLEQILDNPWEV
jgi:hypothetical protein